jgi:hypothetical protein
MPAAPGSFTLGLDFQDVILRGLKAARGFEPHRWPDREGIGRFHFLAGRWRRLDMEIGLRAAVRLRKRRYPGKPEVGVTNRRYQCCE